MKVFNAVEFHILKSFKLFKYSLLFYHATYFFLNNHSMTANSVEKHGFVVLNIKIQVKIRFRTIYIDF